MNQSAFRTTFDQWSGYLSGHRLGFAPLWFSVLVIMLGGRFLSILVLNIIPLTTPGPLVIAVILCDGVVLGWQVAGVLRAAKRTLLENSNMLAAWSAYAMVPVAFFLFVVATLDLLSSGLTSRNYVSVPISSLDVKERQAIITGDIGFEQFRSMQVLIEADRIDGVHISSYGGRIYAARAIAKLVRDNDLSVYVEDVCASACTLIFVASDQRRLAPSGYLGFHGYQKLDQIKTMEIESEESLDRNFLIRRGVSKDFAEKAFAQPPNDIWFPDRQTLLQAGVLPAE